MAAVASSFSYVHDIYGETIDISDVWSTPEVSEAYFLDDSWHKDASFEAFMEDVGLRPKWSQVHLMKAHPNKHETFRAVKDPSTRAIPKRKPKARSEASVQEKREYAKQFAAAKKAECDSWLKENDVCDVVDMRKLDVKNFITGRWVLTIK